MKLGVFKQLIREAVREEIRSELSKFEKRILEGKSLTTSQGPSKQIVEQSNNSLPPEKKKELKEMFMNQMKGPLDEIMSQTVETVNFATEDLDEVPSVLDSLPQFMNKDYSGMLKKMEQQQKQRNSG